MRIPIIHEDDLWKFKKKIKSYTGKEILMSEMNICSYLRNKYLIIVWEKDTYQKEPHFHVIDKETFGNKINCAYSFSNGKTLPFHGSMIQKNLDSRIVSYINRMLRNKDRQDHILYMWNCFNENKTILTNVSLIKR